MRGSLRMNQTLLKLGSKASAEQFGPRELLEFGVIAEEVGFDSVAVSDHFQPWKHSYGHAPYSFAWLGALGERTFRVIIGTSVVTPIFRYHPSMSPWPSAPCATTPADRARSRATRCRLHRHRCMSTHGASRLALWQRSCRGTSRCARRSSSSSRRSRRGALQLHV